MGASGQFAYVSALSARVDGLDEAVRTLGGQVHDIDRRMASAESVDRLSNKIDNLVNNQAERNKTPWPTLISAAGFILIMAGGYSNLSTAPLKEAITQLAVMQKDEGKDFSKDLKEVVKTTAAKFDQIQSQIVPRGEHEQRWANNVTVMANVQRQLDDQVKVFGNVYSLRDALSDLSKRLDRLEMTKLKEP